VRQHAHDRMLVPGAGVEPAWGCPQGIFVPATAFAAVLDVSTFGVWTLPLPCRNPSMTDCDLGRGRQVSTLSPRVAVAKHEALSSVLQPPLRAAVPPTLTPFAWTFPIQVLNHSSPLRLPISPPGHASARRDSTRRVIRASGTLRVRQRSSPVSGNRRGSGFKSMNRLNLISL